LFRAIPLISCIAWFSSVLPRKTPQGTEFTESKIKRFEE
jgi:hypothetical protein